MAPSPGQGVTQAMSEVDTEMPSTAAHDAVLNTVELLEHILLQLPLQDLLLDQRVSKIWKNCIDNSFKLQKALLIIPDGEPTLDLGGHEFSSVALRKMQLPQEPLSADLAFLLSSPVSEEAWLQWRAREDERVQRVRREDAERYNLVNSTINPLLVKVFGIEDLAWMVESGQDVHYEEEQIHRSDSSWRRMILCQPPLPSLKRPNLQEQQQIRDDRYRNTIRFSHADDRILAAHRVLTRILKCMDRR